MFSLEWEIYCFQTSMIPDMTFKVASVCTIVRANCLRNEFSFEKIFGKYLLFEIYLAR